MSLLPLPPLPDDLEPTRSTLHLYANAVGAVAKAHAVPDPKWWHISLKVRPVGLVTDTMAVPGGGTLWLRMDLHQHAVVVETSRGTAESSPMSPGSVSMAIMPGTNSRATIRASTRKLLPFRSSQLSSTSITISRCTAHRSVTRWAPFKSGRTGLIWRLSGTARRQSHTRSTERRSTRHHN